MFKKKREENATDCSDILTTHISCWPSERETNDLFQLPFNEAPLASAHTRQLTVSLWHPLNLEKPFPQITLPLANAESHPYIHFATKCGFNKQFHYRPPGENRNVWCQCVLGEANKCRRGSELPRCRGQRPPTATIVLAPLTRPPPTPRVELGGEGHTKEPPRNKQKSSVGGKWELFLGWWCLCLSPPVLLTSATIWVPFQREVVWNLAAVACGCGATLLQWEAESWNQQISCRVSRKTLVVVYLVSHC